MSNPALDRPTKTPKAHEILAGRKWAPIAFGRKPGGFGANPLDISDAPEISAYAALCLAYPDVETRGKLLVVLKQFTDGRKLSEWEFVRGRTQAEVIKLLKKVEG